VSVPRGTARRSQRPAVALLRSVGVPEHARDLGGQPRSWSPPKRSPDGPRRACRASLGRRDRVGATLAATDQVAQGTEVPAPGGEPRGDGTSAEARVLCHSVPGGPRAAWTLLWSRAQARVIRCTLSTLAEASTPPVRAVSKRKGATDKGDANSVPRGTRPLHRRRTESGNLPEGNDLLVGRVKPSCRSRNPPKRAASKKPGDVRDRIKFGRVHHDESGG